MGELGKGSMLVSVNMDLNKRNLDLHVWNLESRSYAYQVFDEMPR